MTDCSHTSDRRTVAVLAIDPGIHGSLCVMDIDGNFLDITPRPKTRKALGSYFIHWRDSVRIAYIERVGHMPGDGGQGNFTFGQGYGELLMGLEMANILYDTVDPRVWQASMKCMTGGDKKVSRAKAASLWPSMKWTHVNSDAALIARYGVNVLLAAEQQKLRRMGK